ncbi:MAG: phage holin [Eggerthellaceae bacterium]|jgi:phi LC3 family holin|nr:phage holin [Eggerthellaceae bacterium]MCH4220495.1 phage holin [Eggerthellaceae bacterium]
MDWKSRVKSQAFWLTLIPAVIVLLQVVVTPLGYNWDFALMSQQATAFINALFGVLIIIGVVNNPTTPGISDNKEQQ